MFDVIAIGEVLIDFTPVNLSGCHSLTNSTAYPTFQANPGGAPANVVAGISKFGMKTAMIAKMGDDGFGTLIHDTLQQFNVDTQYLIRDGNTNTTLAFVHLEQNGERSFSFFRKPGADTQLCIEDIDFNIIQSTKILHFGSVSMTHEPSRTATLECVQQAKAKRVVVSFDPNIRESLWGDLREARDIILKAMMYADIIKLSEHELYFLTGKSEMEEALKALMDQFELGTKLILVTRGEHGCYFRLGDKAGFIPGFRVAPVDTTGAGDSFMAGILYQLIQYGVCLESLSLEDLENIVRFSNAAAALSTTKRGAIPSLPTLFEVERIM